MATQSEIQVYGADWCAMTTAVRRHLDDKGIDYEYINIDDDPESAAWVASQNNGKEKKPTVKVGGEVMRTPSTRQLDAAIAQFASKASQT